MQAFWKKSGGQQAEVVNLEQLCRGYVTVEVEGYEGIDFLLTFCYYHARPITVQFSDR